MVERIGWILSHVGHSTEWKGNSVSALFMSDVYLLLGRI